MWYVARLRDARQWNSLVNKRLWRPELDTTGTITSFSSTPETRLSIGGDPYGVQVAGTSYSLTNPDPQTLRFEVHQGDRRANDSSSVDRSEVNSAVNIPAGTPINLAYQFMVEPNGPNGSFVNTAWFNVVGQFHNDDWSTGVATSPPFAIQLDGDHLQIIARYCPTGLDPSNGAGNTQNLTLWTDPNPIQTGVYNNIQVKANFSNDSSGYLDVWINGKQVVDYNGPLGYGAATNWEYGLYRSTAPETAAVDYRNVTLLTGSAATAAATPTQPTTPSSPITPPASTTPATPISPSQQQPHAAPVTTSPVSTIPQPITVVDQPLANAGGAGFNAGGAGFLANQGFAMLQQRMETPSSTLAFASPQAIGTLAFASPQAIGTDPQLATDPTMAAQASQSFALLNQYMASNSGRMDAGQIVAAASPAAGLGQAALLARPQ